LAFGGHERRIYASIKFILYTIVRLDSDAGWNSVALQRHRHIDLPTIQALVQTGRIAFAPRTEFAFVWSIFSGIRNQSSPVPLSYLAARRTHRAPTAGSIMLAGVLLKMARMACCDSVCRYFPNAARRLAPEIAVLAIIGILYGALVFTGANRLEASRRVFFG